VRAAFEAVVNWHIAGIVAEAAMSDPVDALVLDLLEWIGPHGRPYAEVIDAWRTSCPRLPVWEEANARGYVIRAHSEGVGTMVSVSPLGATALAERRHASAKAPGDSGAGTAIPQRAGGQLDP
jgi:hypothetical protein